MPRKRTRWQELYQECFGLNASEETMGHPSDDHRRTRGVDDRVEGFCPGRRMSTNAKASVATSSCFPSYEFKADFLKDRSATLKVHNKTPTLDKVRTLIIPSPPRSPEPRIVEIPEEENSITVRFLSPFSLLFSFPPFLM